MSCIGLMWNLATPSFNFDQLHLQTGGMVVCLVLA